MQQEERGGRFKTPGTRHVAETRAKGGVVVEISAASSLRVGGLRLLIDSHTLTRQLSVSARSRGMAAYGRCETPAGYDS